jgi:hypothetical protein
MNLFKKFIVLGSFTRGKHCETDDNDAKYSEILHLSSVRCNGSIFDACETPAIYAKLTFLTSVTPKPYKTHTVLRR